MRIIRKRNRGFFMANNYPFEFFKTMFRINRHLHRLIPPEMPYTPFEMFIFHYLKKNENCKVSDLANYLDIPGSTLTGILDRMESRGLLERIRDQKDRRVVFVTLGQKRTKLREQLEEYIKNFVAHNLSDLPPDWWRQMAEELGRLGKVLQEQGENTSGEA